MLGRDRSFFLHITWKNLCHSQTVKDAQLLNNPIFFFNFLSSSETYMTKSKVHCSTWKGEGEEKGSKEYIQRSSSLSLPTKPKDTKSWSSFAHKDRLKLLYNRSSRYIVSKHISCLGSVFMANSLTHLDRRECRRGGEEEEAGAGEGEER